MQNMIPKPSTNSELFHRLRTSYLIFFLRALVRAMPADRLRVYTHALHHSLDDMLRCHRERLVDVGPGYQSFCACAGNHSTSGSYGDAPWLYDARGAVAAELFLHSYLQHSDTNRWLEHVA